MTTLGWIVLGGLLMSAIALVGSVTLTWSERTLNRVVPVLVGLAAGALIGGALFHLVPAAVSQLGNTLEPYAWLAGGFVAFFVLDQYLHWHHCHRATGSHRPVGYLILFADGLHNLLGGLAVGGAFLIGTDVGIVTWVAAAAHEVPQELGDFGILVHSGWTRRSALLFNLLSGVTFLVGALLAYAVSGGIETAVLVAFAAGNFIYIGAVDLMPQLTSKTEARDKYVESAAVAVGLVLLFVVAVALG